MATTLRIDSFADTNIVERGVLSGLVEAGVDTLTLLSTDGFTDGQVIYVGTLGAEGVEKAHVSEVLNQSELTLTEPLKMAHGSSTQVTAVLGDRIKIYRAANIDGSVPAAESFTLLATRTIDADQPSTYYKDPDGSGAYWYAFSYFNATTEEETERSEPVRGAEFEYYASLVSIRKQAGFENSINLADSYVDEARRQAQSEINSTLAGKFTVPFQPVPEAIRTLTIQLATAILRYNARVGTIKSVDAVREKLQAYAEGDGVIADENGNDLSSGEAVTGYFGNEPRMFSVGQRF